MNNSNDKQKDDLEYLKRRLFELINRWTPNCGPYQTRIKNLSFFRQQEPGGPRTHIIEPSLCYIVQGAKQVLHGNTVLVYNPHRFLITALDLPIIAEIIEASKEQPYLSLSLKLEHRIIAELIMESQPSVTVGQPTSPINVTEVNKPLLEALLRLIELLDEPEHIPVLAPLIEREITYRLLSSKQGAYVRQIALAGHQGYHVARAIDWLKKNFNRKFRMEELASYCQMSVSSFYQYFRKLTCMSPLQYQKYLRLQEARRLMLAEHYDAASASYKVGYESPSQFNREYKRLFKATPLQDIKNLRQQQCASPSETPYQLLGTQER
ncbi:AraC family transcriptional regulator [Treponema sp. J25]|uniref:AraC family transcriptional regulator n=1 Tax=Treponema sp. J25 TaxID=2094121 RepID=UPI001053429D|nr:AraC family transcriptional regulator [Treponema sp. J25]TCW61467.1 AraC family transcriptional regulator [Treponema sp. J25]HPQ01130.1 AraC family transcriptional regulator [Termitinemataceae bacterium]